MNAAGVATFVSVFADRERRGLSRSALALVAAVFGSLFGLAGSAWAQSRGELLYNTHCIACHDKNIHWRDNRRATDLGSLKEQVRLWQSRSLLSWSEEDIVEVTRYLNQRIYRFSQATVQPSVGPSGVPMPVRAAPSGHTMAASTKTVSSAAATYR